MLSILLSKTCYTHSVVACISLVYRNESIPIKPSSFNLFVRSLRDLVTGRGLTDSVWATVRQREAGLITLKDTPASDVTQRQAADFLELRDVTEPKQPDQHPQPPVNNDQDYDDLVSMLNLLFVFSYY